MSSPFSCRFFTGPLSRPLGNIGTFLPLSLQKFHLIVDSYPVDKILFRCSSKLGYFLVFLFSLKLLYVAVFKIKLIFPFDCNSLTLTRYFRSCRDPGQVVILSSLSTSPHIGLFLEVPLLFRRCRLLLRCCRLGQQVLCSLEFAFCSSALAVYEILRDQRSRAVCVHYGWHSWASNDHLQLHFALFTHVDIICHFVFSALGPHLFPLQLAAPCRKSRS